MRCHVSSDTAAVSGMGELCIVRALESRRHPVGSEIVGEKRKKGYK